MGIKLRYTAFGAVTRDRPARWVTAVGTVLLAVMSGLGAVLIGASIWIRRTFGPISIDQMLMHLPGVGGAETTGAETGYIETFVWQALVLPLGITALLFVVALSVSRRHRPRKMYAVPAKGTRAHRALDNAARTVQLRRWAPAALSVTTLAVGASVFVQAVSLPQYIASYTSPLTIDDYYVTPGNQSSNKTVALGSAVEGSPNNLVVIYLESAEDAFSDDSLFEINMNAPLEEATEGWASFENLAKYDGGGWTMAGIVGTECGIPLRGPGIGEIPGGEIGEGKQGYLSGTTCLGDVLSDAGYTNVFMGGADANFASKNNYLRSHGYDEVKDLALWESMGETERSLWGLSDRRLMELAKDEITRLHDSAEPFQLSILTVDPHEPATLFESCPLQTEEPLASVVFCSMAGVASFIEYMDEQGYLEDTAVLITGDHPKQFGEVGIFMEELSTLPSHPLFNRLSVPGGVELAKTEIDQLSLAATLLDILGLGRNDGRAGLGHSALRAIEPSSGAVALTEEEYRAVLASRSSDFYASAWDVKPIDGNDVAEAKSGS